MTLERDDCATSAPRPLQLKAASTRIRGVAALSLIDGSNEVPLSFRSKGLLGRTRGTQKVGGQKFAVVVELIGL